MNIFFKGGRNICGDEQLSDAIKGEATTFTEAHIIRKLLTTLRTMH